MKKILLISALLPLPLQAALVEGWNFNDIPAGAITGDGSAISRGVVSSSPAIILGAGAISTGTGIDLPGGSSATQAYIDLPNGIISARTDMTVNAWMTIDSRQAWQRVFDFGSTTVGGVEGELNSAGGGGEGWDYVLLAPNRGTADFQNRLEARADKVTFNTTDSALSYSLGEPHLFTFVWDDVGGGQSNQAWYLDGVLAAQSGDFNMTLSQVTDVNNWLGRSNWTGDANTDGTYDSFAIYDTAWQADAVANAFAGGSRLLVPEVSSSVMMAGSFLGLLARRKRRA